MDITAFIHSNRDKAFLVGDYSTYRHQLSRQLLKLRRKLGRTTPKNNKFIPKAPVTAQDVGKNQDFVKLQLLAAERAWAHAMAMKSAHNEDGTDEGIAGSARSHILSRLRKAALYADDLVAILKSQDQSKATDTDILEAEAYARVAHGTIEFEKHFPHRYEDTAAQKQAWSLCLATFSEAHIAYTALLRATQKDLFKEVIAGSVDPTIRYAAYQSRLPRTIAISAVAKKHFRKSEKDLLALVTSFNPDALTDEVEVAKKTGADPSSADIPTTITWRGRTAPIADAAIGQSMAATSTAARTLSETVSLSLKDPHPRTPALLAAAYDPVLTAAADTVDAVRRAIADLTKEGIGEADSRMQDLRVSDLATNYALISWRIGRNRILTSSAPALKGSAENSSFKFDDGLFFSPLPPSAPRRRHGKKDKPTDDKMDVDPATPTAQKARESIPHQLSRLTTRHALLTATLQSLDSLSQARGAARDASFMAELDAQKAYFSSLRLLAIAASYKLQRREKEALVCYAGAFERVKSIAASDLGKVSDDDGAAPQLAVRPAQLSALQHRAQLLAERQRGLVALQQHVQPLGAPASEEKTPAHARPLIETLDQYPASGRVDLTKLVAYPPTLRPVPVKPVFLDVAFNYIQYPGRQSQVSNAAAPSGGEKPEQKEEKGRGWFGFGRR